MGEVVGSASVLFGSVVVVVKSEDVVAVVVVGVLVVSMPPTVVVGVAVVTFESVVSSIPVVNAVVLLGAFDDIVLSFVISL